MFGLCFGQSTQKVRSELKRGSVNKWLACGAHVLGGGRLFEVMIEGGNIGSPGLKIGDHSKWGANQ